MWSQIDAEVSSIKVPNWIHLNLQLLSPFIPYPTIWIFNWDTKLHMLAPHVTGSSWILIKICLDPHLCVLPVTSHTFEVLGSLTLKSKKSWHNRDKSILFEDLWFVETPPPMGECMGCLIYKTFFDIFLTFYLNHLIPLQVYFMTVKWGNVYWM